MAELRNNMGPQLDQEYAIEEYIQARMTDDASKDYVAVQKLENCIKIDPTNPAFYCSL